MINFILLARGGQPPTSGFNTVYLKIDHWNDFSFVTMFYMSLHDENGVYHEIENVKIGFTGQNEDISTYSTLGNQFQFLPDNYFSLGGGLEYYQALGSKLTQQTRESILSGLRDVVFIQDAFEIARDERVFSTSLLRSTSLATLKGQFKRVLDGLPPLTNFKFEYRSAQQTEFSGINLAFEVKAEKKPSTNVHAVIGRNGVGKTTLLNGMIKAITNRQDSTYQFVERNIWQEQNISDDFFSSLVSVSFSAFDQFTPPFEQHDPAKGTCYFYIGLKDPRDGKSHRAITDLQDDCVRSLIWCFFQQKKADRWLKAIDKLGSDENFASMGLEKLFTIYNDLRRNIRNDVQSDSKEFHNIYRSAVANYLSRMSSGHAIVLLIITRLVETVEEKTLVLMDEPESHLHPPLLSAFVRALADLLFDRNAVAIIATHSPVVLQEIPASCVWKMYRTRGNIITSRPTIETFGENVGVLTSEVFSLEVERSGFHDLLAKSVNSGMTYEAIIADYNNQLGFEGRAILKSLIANRDRNISHDATD